VIILGAARQGTALARFLFDRGAMVTISDLRPPEDLQATMAALAGIDVNWVLGSHPVELLDQAELVCISGGVPLTIPFLVEARRRGIPFTNDTQVFLEHVPCRVCGITGSAGKTTTTSLVGEIARKAAELEGSPLQGKNVWVGGNIGNPLISAVDSMSPDDVAIVELSSFQLELVTRSPQIAAILNITPNHLDRHLTMEAYTSAKAKILDYQDAQDVAVLGRDDPGAAAMAGRVRGRQVSFGFTPVPSTAQGTRIADGHLLWQEPGRQEKLLCLEDIQLRGEHNQLNVLAACAIACTLELPVQAMQPAVRAFRGVPHRLEYVRTWKGARWYNDSIATAPERAIAAIKAFSEPLVLLAGGRDKNLPWTSFARVVAERVDHLILFGEAAKLIGAALNRSSGRPYSINYCENLYDAVQAAAELVEAGDVVLLSPGGTSFDEFRDFEERGERFREWVNALL
jgi:UDP-N-acetylmuramoylalanine--D-glutamate ligase